MTGGDTSRLLGYVRVTGSYPLSLMRLGELESVVATSCAPWAARTHRRRNRPQSAWLGAPSPATSEPAVALTAPRASVQFRLQESARARDRSILEF